MWRKALDLRLDSAKLASWLCIWTISWGAWVYKLAVILPECKRKEWSVAHQHLTLKMESSLWSLGVNEGRVFGMPCSPGLYWKWRLWQAKWKSSLADSSCRLGPRGVKCWLTLVINESQWEWWDDCMGWGCRAGRRAEAQPISTERETPRPSDKENQGWESTE